MRRKLFTLAAGVSAVLCVGVCLLCVRSAGRRPVGERSIGDGPARSAASRPSAPPSTQASQPPRAWPIGQPDAEIAEMRAASKRRAARAAELVAQIRNRDLTWTIARWDDGSFHPSYTPRVIGGPAGELLDGYALWTHGVEGRPRFRSDEERPALLQALDDPERFAIAHYILSELYGRSWYDDLERRADGTFLFRLYGLKVELRREGEPEEGTTYEGIAAFQKCTARIDPAQLPAIRERWLQEWR